MRRLPWRGAVVPIALLAAAEIALLASGLRSDGLARPSEVAAAMVRALSDGMLLVASLQTLGSALAGLVIGALCGATLGFALGLSNGAARLARLPIELLRPVPPVALIPVAMLSFGLGFRMEIAIVAFTCFWPMLLLTEAAVRGVEPRLLEVARLLRLSRVATVTQVVWPAAWPRIFVALRLSLGIALIVAVTTEVATNPIGLGYQMMRSQQELQPATMYACLVWLALLGWSINTGLATLQARVLSTRGGPT